MVLPVDRTTVDRVTGNQLERVSGGNREDFLFRFWIVHEICSLRLLMESGESRRRDTKTSPLILRRGSGRAVEGNQKRGALARILAANRPSEIVQISTERVDLRVQIV